MPNSYNHNSEEQDKVFLDAIAEMVARDETGVSILNLPKAEMVEKSYNLLKPTIKGKRVRVIHELNAPFKSMAYISATGSEIVITNPKLLVAIARRSGSFEVYPKTDSTIEMDITFHGLTKKLEDSDG